MMVTADSKQAKLWELDIQMEHELITSYSPDQKIDDIWHSETKVDGSFYYVVTYVDEPGFVLCKDRLEEIWTGCEDVHITTSAFMEVITEDEVTHAHLIVGADDGTIRLIDILNKK